MEIYEIENPFWLSDIFIFEYIEKVGYCYVKVNYQDKIEGNYSAIGHDKFSNLK